MPERIVLTVAQLNELANQALRGQFGDVWVRGELSGVKLWSSGHIYFTLKDENSRIDAVCFRFSAQRLKFRLEDGMQVIAHGRLEIYAGSGRYQLVVDSLEPEGLGVLQKAFEQLKNKLAAEGLFAPERKRPLPALPRTVGIVTSPTGAVIRDMLRTMRLHRARVRVYLYPAQVQGDGAAATIVAGIKALNEFGVDVMIVGRGGGSIEDLWCFNEESVARAIAASAVPVISAVGHEPDFTISDFVADVRAATPTAAAVLVASGWEKLERDLAELWLGLTDAMEQFLAERARMVEELTAHRAFESVRLKLSDSARRLESALARMSAAVQRQSHERRAALSLLLQRLTRQHPVERLLRRRELLRGLLSRLDRPVQRLLQNGRARLAESVGRLEVLSPLASLRRGYAIARRPDGAVVSRTGDVAPGQQINLTVTDGTIGCSVTDIRSSQQQTEV